MRPASLRSPRTLAALLASALLVGLLVVVPVAPAAHAAPADAERAFVDRINSTRASKGLSKLVLNTKLADVARGWSGHMAATDQLAHRPGLGTEITRSVQGDWTRVAENVGYTTNAGGQSEASLVDRLHRAFMDSPGHRANILGATNQVGVGVVVAGNGKMWITANFMQAPVNVSSQLPPKPKGALASYQGWTSFDAPGGVSAPAAASWGSGRTDVFAVDGSGRLVQRWYVTGQGWAPDSAWHVHGHPSGVKLVGQPAAVSRQSGSIDVFARGADNQLWQRSYTLGKGWSSWIGRGGSLGNGPSAVSWRPGHVSVFVVSTGKIVYEKRWTDGRWTGWISLGGRATSAPGAASWGSGRMDVFVRGTNGNLYHKPHNGKWHGSWINLGGGLVGSGRPDAVSYGSGRLDLFVVGHRGLFDKGYQAGTGWMPGSKSYRHLGAPSSGIDSGTASATWGSGHIQLFTVDDAGRIWYRTT